MNFYGDSGVEDALTDNLELLRHYDPRTVGVQSTLIASFSPKALVLLSIASLLLAAATVMLLLTV